MLTSFAQGLIEFICRVLIQRSKVHMVIEKVQSEINSNVTYKRFNLMFSFFMHDNIKTWYYL